MSSDYTPYRVLTTIFVMIDNRDDAIASYPHGRALRKPESTGQIKVIYSAGVIDAPTDEEIALFSLPGMDRAVVPIPQDPRGFDARTSGVARSIDGSKRGRIAGTIEKLEREAQAVKSEPEDLPESEPEPEPERKRDTKPARKSRKSKKSEEAKTENDSEAEDISADVAKEEVYE